jgi:hypothetical protein
LEEETLVATTFFIESLCALADDIFEIVAVAVEEGHYVVGDVSASEVR